jgi:2-(1,2-epoxy-1,2-dihydrophenyl)acetyl-CoA isomerase
MKFSAILFDKADAVASITLNCPERLNAFTQVMLSELHQALDAIERDPVIRPLLLTGTGRGFYAGQDLGERALGIGVDLGSSLEKNYNPLLKRLRKLPFPVVCAVNGVAAGAGCNLALACDIVIASRSASFIQALIIGLIPDAGGTYTLPRLVGSARAAGLAMLGEPFARREGRGVGTDLEMRRGCRTGAREPGALPAAGCSAHAGDCPDETGAAGLAESLVRTAASIWKRACSARRGKPRTSPKACALSWKSGPLASPADDQRAGRTRMMMSMRSATIPSGRAGSPDIFRSAAAMSVRRPELAS